MSLLLQNPEETVQKIVNFLRQVYQQAKKETAVIAVSGGIDSALSLTLLRQALGSEKIKPILLPFGQQSMADAEEVVKFNAIPKQNQRAVNIQPLVSTAADLIGLDEKSQNQQDRFRLGNLMARSRMMMVYDLAKKENALVCGTENKSEKYLGYFTRFGDEASDVEPLVDLYKTQVRQLADFLQIPSSIQTKAPSAGLWSGQTDENELGFSYELADRVLEKLIDQKIPAGEIQLSGVEAEKLKQVIKRVEQTAFKHQVPYVMD